MRQVTSRYAYWVSLRGKMVGQMRYSYSADWQQIMCHKLLAIPEVFWAEQILRWF